MVDQLVTLKVIIADTDSETFNGLKKLNNKFNTIFLSSEFAVNFILEYEKIDIAVISKKISNLNGIIERANKRNTKILMLGRDLNYPIAPKELEEILEKEYVKKKANSKKGRISFKNILENLNIRKNKFINKYFENRLDQKNISIFDSHEDKTLNNLEIQKLNKTQFINISNNRKKEDSISEYDKNSNPEKIPNEVDLKTSFTEKLLPIKNDSNIKDDQGGFVQNTIKIIKQKVIILTKAKGGVGSTTISLFLSAALKDFSTLLIDLNFSEGGGDISYYLDIPKSPNILNFLNGYNTESLENSIIRLHKNLDILQSPPTFEMSKKIELQDIYCLTDIAKKKYHLIIFDLPNQLSDLYLGVIDLADLLILISDFTLGSIGRLSKINNRYLYEGLEKLLVFNRYQKQNGLNPFDSQISDFFKLDDYIFIEEDEILRKKVDYSDYDFSSMAKFHKLTNKVLELLAN